MFTNFINLFLTSGLSLMILAVMMLLGKKTFKDREQASSFECGFNVSSRGLLPFSLQFYLVANIFLIFDVELILLFPLLSKLLFLWIYLPLLIFTVMILLLSLGLFHEWNQKMLDWSK